MEFNEPKAVGVLGIGLLGAPIAQRILTGGYQVLGYDIDELRRVAARKAGVPIAESVREVGETCDLVLSVLPSAEALQVVCSELAVPGSGARARCLVDVSTLALDVKSAVAAALGHVGIAMLDCPVLGTSAQAYAGELVMCCSGPQHFIQRCDAVFSTFAARREDMGAFGNGTKIKLVSNMLVGIHNVAAAEALIFAKRAGIEPATALRVLIGSAGGSRQMELRGGMMVKEVFEPAAATTKVFIKDMGLISDLARSVGCPVLMHATASGLFAAAMAMGCEDSDLSSVHSVVATLAGDKS
ncbi:NAD(P)-dependent oxidoreductase [Bradyrhizobium viridifuturi]|uniref:NAD(P)-dependent oxidoreductase n=1 Tax=Bradyrhizobium viridifuturi TaxID=1654716 RepID=UPI00067EAFAE|nr:NAD(P)-dependent oxidoreductase [Bradyrhizobium viridifuturi]